MILKSIKTSSSYHPIYKEKAMKKFIVYTVLMLAAIIIGAGFRNFAEGEKPIFSGGRMHIDEIVKRLVNQERSSYPYHYYIILDGQPEFKMKKSAWDNFTGAESFGYIPVKWSSDWMDRVTPTKEEKYHRISLTNSESFAPLVNKELTAETKPANYSWKSWDSMWGPQKSK